MGCAMTWYLNLSYTMELIVAVLFSLGLTLFLMVVMERWVAYDVRVEHNDLTSFIFGSLGIFSALIISSVLVIAVEHFNDAGDAINHEANVIINMERLSHGVSPAFAQRLHPILEGYVRVASTTYWDLRDPKQARQKKRQSLEKIAWVINTYTPKTPHEASYHQLLVDRLGQLYDSDHALEGLATDSISSQVWLVTLIVGLLTLIFALLYGAANKRMHLLLTSLMAMTMGITYVLIVAFDSPFAGDLNVDNAPYMDVLSDLHQNSTPPH